MLYLICKKYILSNQMSKNDFIQDILYVSQQNLTIKKYQYLLLFYGLLNSNVFYVCIDKK